MSRRDQIRAVALAHFSEKGYRMASLRDIAAESGIRAGTMYNYFASKEQLLFEVALASITERIHRLNAVLDRDASPSRQLRQAVRFHVTEVLERPAEARVTLNECGNLTGDYHQRIQEERNAYQRLFEEILEAGMAAGEFRPMDVKLTTYAILAIGQGAARPSEAQPEEPPHRLGESYADLVLRSIRLPEMPLPAHGR